MCVAWMPEQRVGGGFSQASVGGLPGASAESFHTTDLNWPRSWMTCNGQMGMCDVIQYMHACVCIYVCGAFKGRILVILGKIYGNNLDICNNINTL